MFKVKVSEVKGNPSGQPEETVLLEQTLERLNLRAVIDTLNPPARSHRRKP